MAGYSMEQIHAFFQREDVRAEMAALDREFKHGAIFSARTQYATRKQLAQLAPGAVGLLAKAMAGPQYLRGPDGTILKDARGFPILKESELTPNQLRAAEIVVDAVGGGDAKNTSYHGDVQVNVLLASNISKVTIDQDSANATPEQQALSRERMRNAIDHLMLKLPTVQERVRKALAGPETVDVKSTKVKKVVRKLPKVKPDAVKKTE
jgi:hypothetical protein